MAWSEVTTKIQNPAARIGGKGKAMADKAKRKKKLTPKQVKWFGTARQKAALKASRSTKRAKAKAQAHRPRTKPNPAKASAKKRSPKKSAAKRSNPAAEIISWTLGNPAKKAVKKMARKAKKKAAGAQSSTGARRPKKTKQTKRHSTKRNPGQLGSPMDWVQGGAGVLGGVVGARALPQMILGPANTGPVGYMANFITAAGLGWLTHMLFPRNRVLTGAVIAGGFAGTFARIISDKTSFGSALSMTGLGDWGLGLYQKSNFNNPQRIQAPRGPNSSMFTWGDGTQGAPAMPAYANAGSDSSMPC